MRCSSTPSSCMRTQSLAGHQPSARLTLWLSSPTSSLSRLEEPTGAILLWVSWMSSRWIQPCCVDPGLPQTISNSASAPTTMKASSVNGVERVTTTRTMAARLHGACLATATDTLTTVMSSRANVNVSTTQMGTTVRAVLLAISETQFWAPQTLVSNAPALSSGTRMESHVLVPVLRLKGIPTVPSVQSAQREEMVPDVSSVRMDSMEIPMAGMGQSDPAGSVIVTAMLMTTPWVTATARPEIV